jgi:alcohol dehydrogenase (cytochrome c)
MRRTISASLGAAAAALLVTSLVAQVTHGGAQDFSAARLTAHPTTSWPTNGGNLYNQRYSPLTGLDRTNVGRLKGVWRTQLRGSGTAPKYSGFAAPIVYDGSAYVSTGANDVFALSLDTGEILWQYAANVDPNITSVCCGWNNKGVAVSEDKVFAGQLDGKLVALDRATGRIVWSIQAERWQESFSITAAPLYVEGKVIVGFAGGDRGTRGRIKAYDARDGKLLWTFYTIPGPGETGHESWPKDNDAWKYGGAAIWQTPAVDPVLGLLYLSTGNAGPDYNGAFRAGDNLFAASIVAIELETGKTGWAYILDRETGEPLIGIDEKPVPQEPRQKTAATQPFPRGDAIVPQFIDMAPEGHRLVNDGRIFTPFVGNVPTLVLPGIWGGASWPPSSYDPVQRRLFVCASSVINGYTGGGDERFVAPKSGADYLGGAMSFTRVPRIGILAALDVTTNKLAWRYQWPEQCYSGTLATAGGLLLVGRNDGRLTALDSSTGAQIWEFQTGAGMHAPVSVFEHRGKPHVLAYSAGSALLGTARGDSVWLLGLDGTLPPASPGTGVPRTAPTTSAAPATAPVTATAPPPAALRMVDANVAEGRRLFTQNCAVCHGDDGKGGHTGGAPLDRVSDFATATQTVTTGRNAMPPFRGAFTPEQIRDVSAYVIGALKSGPPK